MGSLSFATTQANTIVEKEPITYRAQDSKVQIEPEELPQKVKESILDNEEVKMLPVSEAFKVTDQQGEVSYEVQFGMEETVIKTYDEEGNELED
ncbi:hypothetical protein GCM10007049_32750 [Echinicola pacifica]|uniref:Uncharacterized protein n=2 Tax=Echinicola pacifica TaxID=346377 RepID=A0A918Q922_9BACT|nr:hypothetical protein GCM10007049_32750 [Echinicola pacifica]